MKTERPLWVDCVEEIGCQSGAGADCLAVKAVESTSASQVAGAGTCGVQIFASFRRFWAVAALMKSAHPASP